MSLSAKTNIAFLIAICLLVASAATAQAQVTDDLSFEPQQKTATQSNAQNASAIPTTQARQSAVRQTGFAQPLQQRAGTVRPTNQQNQPTSNANALRNRLQAMANPQPQQPLTLTGKYMLQKGSSQGYLIMEANLSPGSYIYSLTQKGFPSRISIAPSKFYQTGNQFQASAQPHVIPNDPVLKTRLEKHKDSVQFFVPFQIAPGTDPSKINATMQFDGQVCTDAGVCMPVRGREVVASFGGYFEPTPPAKNQAGQTAGKSNPAGTGRPMQTNRANQGVLNPTRSANAAAAQAQQQTPTQNPGMNRK